MQRNVPEERERIQRRPLLSFSYFLKFFFRNLKSVINVLIFILIAELLSQKYENEVRNAMIMSQCGKETHLLATHTHFLTFCFLSLRRRRQIVEVCHWQIQYFNLFQSTLSVIRSLEQIFEESFRVHLPRN